MRECISVVFGFILLFFLPTLGLAQTKGDAKAGKAKYAQLCAGCHGATGNGNGPAAAALNPKPKDFADCKVMAKESDKNLFKIIKEGGQSVGRSPMMPSWKASVKDPDIQNLVAYVRTFCKK